MIESCAVTLDKKHSEALGFHRPHVLLELLGENIFSFFPETFFKKLTQLSSSAEICEINYKASVEHNS